MFFFSSRRRHTRSYGDWSSDVCSSDLDGAPEVCTIVFYAAVKDDRAYLRRTVSICSRRGPSVSVPPNIDRPCAIQARSEERRVGKECRLRAEAVLRTTET